MAAFHTFRHTFASIHIREGTGIVALARALGHHSPAFTLSRYAHLLPGELAPPLDLAAALSVLDPTEPGDRRFPWGTDWGTNLHGVQAIST